MDLTTKFREYLRTVNQSWGYIHDNPQVKANVGKGAFLRLFPQVMVSVQMRDLMPNEEEIMVFDDRNEILFRGSTICDRYIRFLGPGITRMTLHYRGLNEITSRTLNQLIVENCAPHLEEIRLIGIRTMDELATFPLVQTVHIVDSDLGVRLKLLSSTIFPNANTIVMENLKVENFSAHFGFLRRLCIKSNSYAMNYGMSDAAYLWYDNRYLRILEIEMIGDRGLFMKDLLESIQHNGSLSILSVKTDIVQKDVTREEIDNLTMTHPELTKLHLYSYMFARDDVIYLIDRLPWLQSFAYQINMSEEWNDMFAHAQGVDSNIERLQRALGNTWQARDGDFILITKNM